MDFVVKAVPRATTRTDGVHRKDVPRCRGWRGGFSLVEIMVILTVVGLMASIAAPPMFRYLQSNELQTNSDRLAADLQYARSLAVANGMVLRFTATTDGYTLTDPVNGTVIRDQDFKAGLNLAAAATADFFPWGMANATVFNLSNGAGARQINLLPTGVVEVH